MLYKTGDLQMAAAFFCMLNVDDGRYNFHVTNVQYQQIRESAREQYKYRYAVPVIRLDTEQTFISASEAERIINAPKSAVSNAIRTNHRLYGTWWMRLDDFLDGKRPIMKPKKKPTNTVQVICVETGKTYLCDAAADVKCHKTNIQRAIASGGIASGYHWKQLQPPKRATGKRPVINLDTGEIFPSARDAARHYGYQRLGSITGAIHSGKPYKGYRWKYLDE